MTIAMFIFGVLTILSGCGVVFSVKSLNCALWLVVTLFLVAVHFALIGADFLAALQILVYAGAIMVLVIFVIMLLGLKEEVDPRRFDLSVYMAVVVVGAFVGMLLFMVKNPASFGSFPDTGAPAVAGDPSAVGYALFTKFLFPFEVTSILLLAAIIGATVIAFEPKRPLPAGRGLKAKRTAEVKE